MQQHKIFTKIEESGLLPELPVHVSEILQILKNPIDADIDLLIDKIARNTELNQLMLKNLNSGYFQLNKEIRTIKEAIVYLGMQTVQNLLIFFITRQLFAKSIANRRNTFEMHQYWKHVLGTSVASCMLAARTKTGDKYKLFSYGLVHDIGIIVMDACLPDIVDEIMGKIFKGVHQIVAERIVMKGITHSEIGAWLCRKWNIRNDITNIVEFHHTPLMARDNADDVRLIYLADVISAEYYQKLLGFDFDKIINYKTMDSLGISENDLHEVAKALPKELEKVEHYFSMY